MDEDIIDLVLADVSEASVQGEQVVGGKEPGLAVLPHALDAVFPLATLPPASAGRQYFLRRHPLVRGEVPLTENLPVLVTTSVQTYSDGLCKYLIHLGLPTDKVLAAVDDRRKVVQILPDAIDRLPADKREQAYYISKMIVACGAGLFDAGLTYLWDAVVASLRQRVANFDLDYFFDNAIPPGDRGDFKTAEDLRKVDDSKLISGCLKCGILTDVAYKELDHIRDMRNWASAAHPNNAEIGGIQLMGWLETCVKQVFAVDVTGPAVDAHQLLRAIREQTLTAADVPPIGTRLAKLPNDTASALLRSAVGLYTSLTQERRVLDNVMLLAVPLWKAAPEEARHDVGLKYAALSANGQKDRKERVNAFLQHVDGMPYLPANELTLVMQEKLAQLESAHFGWDNFHNEPPLAREVRRLVGPQGVIPDGANEAYVRTLLFCWLGRRSGVSNSAVPSYDEMINLFGDPQIKHVLNMPYEVRIHAKLAEPRMAERFRSLAGRLAKRTHNKTLVAPLTYISGLTNAQVPGLNLDTTYKNYLSNIL